ncbi:MAG: Ada metal-binding domain-containing protein [Planctomycetota bacterium]
MIRDTQEMTGKDIWPLITSGQIKLGGHRSQMLYGRIDCQSAKRFIAKGTYQKNRILFESEAEAIELGYRPCSRCLPKHYARWSECMEAGEPYTLEVANSVVGETVEWMPLES